MNNQEGIGPRNGGGSIILHSYMLPLEREFEQETVNGVEYTNPDSTQRFFQWLVGYVDDSSILIKLEHMGCEVTAEQMLEAAKRCLEV